jgi:hypothetical protein
VTQYSWKETAMDSYAEYRHTVSAEKADLIRAAS